MAVFYKQDAETPSTDEGSFVGKLIKRAKNLSETVPTDIRDKLATLSAEVNGKTDELKKATKENSDKLKTEIRDLTRTTTQGYVREDKTAQLKKDKRFEKLLANKQGFDTITAGNIGRMRENGENIAQFLLTDDEGDEVTLNNTNVEALKNKKLLINFGDNKSLNASIGLGDILPYEVKKVEITDKNGKTRVGTLGSQDSRKGRNNRVGYYDENGVYIAIYGGYSVKILETGIVNEEDKNKYEGLQNENFKRLRINEMMDFCIAKNGLKKISSEETKTLLEKEYLGDKDMSLFPEVSERINSRIARGEHMRESYKDGIGSRDKFVGKFGWYMRDVVGKDFPNIPAYMLVNLFDKESDPRGSFDPGAQNASGAYGLGQMQPAAWADAEKHANIRYDKSSPYDQIHASAAYLNFIMTINNCTIQDAIVYYHMGPYVKSKHIDTNNIEMLEKYKKSNPAVAKEMKEDTWGGYMKAARYYYTEESSLLSSLDLSKTGTELATKLGDYVMSTSLPNTGVSSCGEAVGTLLNRFGVESLPQSGRDGKNWDTILEPRIHSGQFKKVPIKHPDEAGSGAILVFDEGASGVQKGSKRFDFGHVEIKGSDGKYYSYYEGTRAAGSAANSSEGVKDPAEYQRITGFTGYAYYPVTKKA